MTINDIIRQSVRKRAKYLCEYCHSPEKISTSRFTIDHIKPRSLGGSDELENLALACSRCNQKRFLANSFKPIFSDKIKNQML